jgi:hypothetical protein
MDLVELIGDEVDNDELLDWEKDIENINSSLLNGFGEIRTLSRRLGKLDYYSHNLIPNFQVETNKNGDTIYVTKIYRFELLFEKGISFYKFSSDVINIDNSFFLIDELRWHDRTAISSQNAINIDLQEPYIVFSYNYGQILFDSRENLVYLNNNENPDYFVTKLKLTKHDKKQIFNKLTNVDFFKSPQNIDDCTNYIEPSPSCDVYRVNVDGIEYVKRYCCSSNEIMRKNFNELGQLLRELIESKKSYKKTREKAKMFIAI